jgi:magnesium transporter
LIKVFKHDGGVTTEVDRVDPAWLKPNSGVWVWVALESPSPDEARVLSDVFHFHELAVEDALTEVHHPKIESYGDYLYLILHGIDFQASEHCFTTKDVDFFLGAQYLVTVHAGMSRSIDKIGYVCTKDDRVLGEGPGLLMYRIVDTMVDNYRPEIEKLGERLDEMEEEVFEKPNTALARRILDFKRDIASLRRIVLPQRDAVGRLARREFPMISEQLAYRFRDVHDHLVRLSDEAMFFQDRITSILDAHLSAVSNQLNQVMKVLTIIATLFMPLTFVTGLYGMNVDLPHFGLGGTTMFWVLMFLMLGISVGMLMFFRARRWL